ncbi:heterokaryon incompatibility protein-domain-containing protein [Xylaria acuta]|nr:heterokaryon incompatibility protein-domain-containing protein [Xylaria acuta]
MDTPSRFCDKCQAIQFNDAEWGGYAALDEEGKTILKFDEDDRPRRFEIHLDIEDIYPSFPFLSKSAANGCDCCGMLKHSAAKAFTYQRFDGLTEEKFRISVEYLWDQYDEQKKRGLSMGLDGLLIHLDILYDEDACQEWLNLKIVALGKFMTPETISWVYSKLNSCRQCDGLLRSKFIPTRLVQVDCDPPRLVEMNGPTIDLDSVKYAALSYCWGSGNEAMLQLTTENLSLANRLSGILGVETTSVLRDAITICKALSITFLWIDALCIVQDDPEDWQRESSLMGQIYSNAYLTICALLSNSCTEGFLDRKMALTVPFRSHVVSGIQSTFYLTHVTHPTYVTHDLDIPSRHILSDMYSSLWSTRGWVLQERVMSARMLMFGHSRSHFFCGHKLQTQDEETSFGNLMGHYTYIQSRSNIDDVYREWYEAIVGGYLIKRLTHETDRLPAISGLATFFNEKLRDEYVAGLWRRQLHQGLDWHCVSLETKQLSWLRLLNNLTDTARYVAPSWSWASRTCYVEFGVSDGKKQRGRTEYGSITPHIRLAGTNPYGQLSNAVLKVTTKLVRVPTDITFEARGGESCVYVTGYTRPYARCILDWGLGPDGERLTNVSPDGLMLMQLAGVPYKHRPPSPSPVATELDALSAGEKEEKGESEKEKSQEEMWEGLAYGLIIYQIPETDNFLRVGVFESRASDGWGLRIFDHCEPMTFNLI